MEERNISMEYNIHNFTNITDVDFTNCTLYGNDTDSIFAFLECSMGRSRIEIEKLIPITVIYVIIFICGFLGNISVCVVIVKNNSMHTATNFYLFSLAVSDLTLLLFGLPNDLNSYWHQYPWTLGESFCKARAMVAEMTNYASVLTIVAFSLERYLAICHPLFAYTMAGLGRAVKIIALVWITSFFCSVPFAVYSTVNYRPYPGTTEDMEESAFCAMLNAPMYLYEISTIAFFILPMGILSILYACMGIRIRQTSLMGKEFANSVHKGCNGDSKNNASKKNIIRMLTAVVVGFFICWAPFHAQRLLYLYGMGVVEYKLFQIINERLFYIAGFFYFMSAVINPILYNLMSERYRNAFKETVCCRLNRGADRFKRTAIVENGQHSTNASSRNGSVTWARERSVSISTRLTRLNSEDSIGSKRDVPQPSFVWRVLRRSFPDKPVLVPVLQACDLILPSKPLLDKPSDDAWEELATPRKNGSLPKNTLRAGCNPSCLAVETRKEPEPPCPETETSREEETDSQRSVEIVIKRMVSFSGLPNKEETPV